MRFHVEHFKLKQLLTTIFESDTEVNNTLSNLLLYADLIHGHNKKFNLTGHKNLTEIIADLIIGSIEPLSHINVPRGTLMCDLGTGSGIPGIPLTIINKNLITTLIDSNNKKIRFINMVSQKIKNNTFTGISGRIEEIAHNHLHRNKYDIVISRAMSDIYTMSELAAPLLKNNGLIILYTREDGETIKKLASHFHDLGIKFMTKEDANNLLNISSEEILILKKTGETAEKYPRRINNIKRSQRDIMSDD